MSQLQRARNLPLQGLMCCVFWDASLITTAVKRAYFSFHSIPVTSNQSGHFTGTSAINKAFPSQNCSSLDYIFCTICSIHCWVQTLQRVFVGENPRSAVSKISKPVHLAPIIMPLSKSLRSNTFPIHSVSCELMKALDLYLYDFTQWAWCVIATWLADWIIAYMSGVKVFLSKWPVNVYRFQISFLFMFVDIIQTVLNVGLLVWLSLCYQT